MKIKFDKDGKIPLKLDLWGLDNIDKKIEVDYFWLRNILQRLTILKKMDKNTVTRGDIQFCKKYLSNAFPKNILKKYGK